MSKLRKWKYILLLQDGGSYFGDTLLELFKEIMKHRVWHFKRGDGWRDKTIHFGSRDTDHQT